MSEAVNMKNISKYFGDFCALNNVNLRIEKGTIHALLGENGAGKSTLMNILYGIYNQTSGEIFVNGKKVDIKNPAEAISLGIGMVHQHFMLVETLTVLDNIILGQETTKNIFGTLSYKIAIKLIMEISEKYELFIELDSLIQDISVGMQQRVEIIKTLYRGSEIIILDEPTAVLTPQEIEELIKIVENLTQDGKTVIIITHKLDEIKRMADYCTIIRRGIYIDTIKVSDVNQQELASMMVGREVNLNIDRGEAHPKEIIFSIKNLTVKDQRGIEKVKNLNIDVKRGEIYGIAGIDGNGQKELIEAITNLRKSESGEIIINESKIHNATPKTTIKSGVSTIHEDRHRRGLILDFTVAQNSILEIFNEKPYSAKGILDDSKIIDHTRDLIKEFDIRPEGCERKLARELSGGNQQKLIIARELYNNPDLLIAVQPTRGLDVGAIEFVHRSLISQRDNGKAVLLISFELDEIMDISDRIGVIFDGTIVETFENNNDIDEKTLGYLMAGGVIDV